MGTVLGQCGEGKEEMAVAVEFVLGTDLVMDGYRKVAELTDHCASLCREVVIAVVRSQMEDAIIDASVATHVFFLPGKSVLGLLFGLDGRRRQGRSHLGGNPVDMILQNLIGGERHGAVVVALHLVERHILVTRELQHAPEVGLLLIASVEFQFAVAGDDDDGRGVGTDVGERGVLVDGGLQGADALLLTYIVMCNALPAKGHESRERVGINAVLRQPALVESDHVEQIATCRVSGHEYLAMAAIVLRDVLVCPGHGCRGVVEDVVNRSLRQQTVVHRNDHESAVLQLRVDVLLAALDAAAVEPHNYGCVRLICRIIHVEFAALLGIALCRLAIRDVIHLVVLRPCDGRAKQEGKDEEIAFIDHVV